MKSAATASTWCPIPILSATPSRLVPETGTNGDLGFGWSGRFSEGTGRFPPDLVPARDAGNAITLYSTPFAAKYINSGDTRTRGLELEGKVAQGRRADVQFAFTRQEGKYVGKDGYYYFGGATSQQRWPGQTVHAAESGDGRQRAAQPALSRRRSTTFAAYTYLGKLWRDVTTWENPLQTFDLGAHYKIAKGWKLSAGVNDLFNAGPKQTLGGTASDVTASWRQCIASGLYVGQPGCGTSRLQASRPFRKPRPLKSNVDYPQQGRTWYATLAYWF